MFKQIFSSFSRYSLLALSLIMCSVLAACGDTPPIQTSKPTPIAAATTPTSPPAPAPTETIALVSTTAGTPLTGPINFIANKTLNFSSASGTSIVNGATTQLSETQVEDGVTDVMHHVLFEVNSNTNIKVYTPTPPSPTQAQVGQNADGSTSIRYTHTTKSGITTFNGKLLGDQLSGTYASSSMSATRVNNQDFSGGNNSTATFTTPVTWITSEQLAAPPTNGRYQITPDGGVALTWTPGAASALVKQYNIYRFVLTDPNGFQFLASTQGTSYTDSSTIARNNAQTITGMAYAIYAVGSSGVENPTDTTISVSSLP